MNYNDLKQWLKARYEAMNQEQQANRANGLQNGYFDSSKDDFCKGYLSAIKEINEYLSFCVQIQ